MAGTLRLDPRAWRWVGLLGIVLAAVDAAVRRLPDRLTFAASGGALLVLAVAALTTGSNTTLTRAVLAALGLAAVYLYRSSQPRTGGMGPGDGKLALAIGLCLGAVSLTAVVTATLAAVLLGGGYVAAMLLSKRITRADAVAHGPFMLLGALVALILRGGS